jgi:hypothetical protein
MWYNRLNSIPDVCSVTEWDFFWGQATTYKKKNIYNFWTVQVVWSDNASDMCSGGYRFKSATSWLRVFVFILSISMQISSYYVK